MNTPTSTMSHPRFGSLAGSGVAQGHENAAVHTDAATRESAVRMVTDHAREHGSLALACSAMEQALGIPRATLRYWTREAQVEPAARQRPTAAECEELEQLRAEVRRLREDNAMLQATAAFLAGAERRRSA